MDNEEGESISNEKTTYMATTNNKCLLKRIPFW